MDFMSDCLFEVRPFRILIVVDCHTREALSLTPRANFRAFQVTEALDASVRQRGRPKSLRVDNGPEFAGRILDPWAYLNGVEIDFSRPGKPTDNAYIESFNGRLRAEYRNASWFLSMADTRDRIEQWRRGYNAWRFNWLTNAFRKMKRTTRIRWRSTLHIATSSVCIRCCV